jgi:hypothetical protein
MEKEQVGKGFKVRAAGYVRSGYFSRGAGIHYDYITEIEVPVERDNYMARMLLRYEEEFAGIIVGVSHRMTGYCHRSGSYSRWDYGDKKLVLPKRHFVVMVQPTHTSKWLKPRACLLKDLKLLETYSIEFAGTHTDGLWIRGDLYVGMSLEKALRRVAVLRKIAAADGTSLAYRVITDGRIFDENERR